MVKPSMKEFMDATGADSTTASNVLYGDVGANMDTRDWGAIMSSDNVLQSAQGALTDMYSDPVYREANIPYLVQQGYQPAQAYYTYGQMVDRVGADYTPSAQEVNVVEDYFKQMGEPDKKWLVGSNTNTANTNAGIGTNTGINTGIGTDTGSSSFNYSPTTVGGLSGQAMGAGGANYQSDLIKSLRQSDNSLMSENRGFTRYGYTVPTTPGSGA